MHTKPYHHRIARSMSERPVTRTKTNKLGAVLGGPVPSRGELDRGRRALEIVEKQMDLGERAGKLLRADAVKAQWSGFLVVLSSELQRLPGTAAGAVSADLGIDANRAAVIEGAIARCVAELRDRLVHIDDAGDGTTKE